MNQKLLESMAEYYNEWWENPCDPRGAVFAKLNSKIARLIQPGEGKTALDLGSGAGAIIRILLNKGYTVDGIEYSSEAAEKLKKRFPTVEIIQADINQWVPEKKYDLITAIELVQNFDEEDTKKILQKLRPITSKLLITMPNRDSLQGKWVTWRNFKAAFVYLYSVKQFEKIALDEGWKIKKRMGVGFLMPITLFHNFRVKLIPVFFVRIVNSMLDPLFPNLCSLYYIELE